MTIPVIRVDFNEMVEPNLVLLSATDTKVTADGNTVHLSEGLRVKVYMDDKDQFGNVDNLVADGLVEENMSRGWSRHVKWCCRIDEKGIRPYVRALSVNPSSASDQTRFPPLRIWRLHVEANKYMSVKARDLDYFKRHFVGVPLENWSPPPMEVDGKSKKLADFAAWTIASPLVSKRAKNALCDVLAGHAEFLPFHTIKGRNFFAMNVISIDAGILDISKSDIWYSSAEPRKALSMRTAVFVDPLPKVLRPIFKVAVGDTVFADIFVSRPFVETAVKERLSGFSLADPGEEALGSILDNRSQNVVPGIVG